MFKGFPAIMGVGEVLPPDQVLELVMAFSGSEYSLNFPFWLSVNKIRSGFLVLFPIYGCFSIWGKKRRVEDIVYFPCDW